MFGNKAASCALHAFALSFSRQAAIGRKCFSSCGLSPRFHSPTCFSPAQRDNTSLGFLHTSTSLNAVQYLLTYEYVPDILERRDPHRPGHIDLAKKFIGEGKCDFGGPIGGVGTTIPSGALFVFNDVESAKTFAAEDPYMTAGLVTSHTIQEWNVVVQKE